MWRERYLMAYPVLREATWPLSLPANLPASKLQQIKDEVDRLADTSQYGWGQTIDFGPFKKDGLLQQGYLKIAGAFDDWGWWPTRLDGLRTADIGCFTGGSSLLMAHRGAATVYAVDEIPEHLAQCAFLVQTFGIETVRPLLRSAYRLREDIAPGSLDIILLSGVLYHMSDMLVGLYAMRELLKPGGVLLIQSNGIDDFEQSYANFGRFIAGRWWQPTGLCIQDMLEFMGFRDYEVRFYKSDACLVHASTTDSDIPFKRGLNWPFEILRDARPRSLDAQLMAPVRAAQRNDAVCAPDQAKHPSHPEHES
jgi:SAM-dependent methyltransferase